MHPRLFDIPWLGWPINSYGFLIMVGFLLATYIGVRRGNSLGIKSDLILDIGIISMIVGIVGAKINYVWQYPEHFMPPRTTGNGFAIFDFGDGGMNPLGALILGPIPFAFWYWRTAKEPQMKLYSWQNGVLLVATLLLAVVGTRTLYLYQHRAEYNWSVFTTWQSGFVLYGGLISAVLAGILYTRMRGESIARISDLGGPLIMLGLAFGRIGCFLNGCCYGTIWENGFCAVRFPQGSAPYEQHLSDHKLDVGATQSLPVIPTQLFETAVALALFFALTWYDRRKKKNPGETILLTGVCYAVWRFIVEFMRDDPRPQWLGSLSYSQTLGIGVAILCGVWYYFVRFGPAAPPTGLASEAAGPSSPMKTSDRR